MGTPLPERINTAIRAVISLEYRNHTSASRGPEARTSGHASRHQILCQDSSVRSLSEKAYADYARTGT